jgi:hypothetical protein
LGRDHDQVDAARDEAVDSVDLVIVNVLRVREQELDAAPLGFCFDRFRVGDAPIALGTRLSKSNDELLERLLQLRRVRAAFVCSTRGPGAARARAFVATATEGDAAAREQPGAPRNP